jgi:lambda family phage tail tape measure protein
MPSGKPVGTAFAEINLDSTKLEQGLKRTNDALISGSVKVEDAYKSLGIKSDQVYSMMKANATAAVDFIKNKTLSSKEEIVRAEQAAAAKIAAINEQQFGKHTSLLDKAKQNWIALSAAAVAAGASMGAAMAYIEEGAKAMQQESSFKIIADEAGVSSEKMIDAMKKATKGTVDDSDLMQKSVKMMLAGYNPDQIERFSKVAITASQYMGANVSESFERISDALSSRMPKAMVQAGAVIRDQMGIVQEAMKNGADSTSLLELAIANLSVKQLQLQGTQDGATLAVQRFHTQIKELKEEIGKELIWAGMKLFGVFQAIGAASLTASAGIWKFLSARYALKSMLSFGDEARLYSDASKQYASQGSEDYRMSVALAGKSQDNIIGSSSETGGRASKSEIDKAKANRDAILAKLKNYSGGSDAAGNAAKKAADELARLTERYAELNATMEDPISSTSFMAEMNKIDAKYEKMKREYSKVSGSAGEIEGWKQAELEKEARKENEKIIQENIKDQQEIYKWQEAQQKIVEQQKKDMLEIYQNAEARITDQINELDLAEALGSSHIGNLKKRIELEAQIVNIRKMAAAGASTIDDGGKAFREHNDAVMAGMKAANKSIEEQKEQIGSLDEGWKKGWQNYKENSMTAFKAGEEMAKGTAQAMQDAFGEFFFDWFEGNLNSLGDYLTSFGKAVQKILADIAAQMATKYITSGLSSGWSALVSIGSAIAGSAGGATAAGAGTDITTNMGSDVTVSLSALGNIFSGGQAMAFANGGVYDRPTIFPMARGMGLMGEAGPEAVMPLKRTKSGKLGVAMEGGGSNVVNTSLTVNGMDKKWAAELRADMEDLIDKKLRRAM